MKPLGKIKMGCLAALAVIASLSLINLASSALRETTLRSYVHKMSDSRGSVCSAVMIAPERAMTAGHCMDMLDPKLTVNGVDYPIPEGYKNPAVDLGVLIVPGAPCPCAPVSTTPTQQDEQVTNIGYPYGLLQVLTVGLYQGRIVADGLGYMVSTARSAPGMSGGGIFNEQGELIGIVSAMDEVGLLTLGVELFTQQLTWE